MRGDKQYKIPITYNKKDGNYRTVFIGRNINQEKALESQILTYKNTDLKKNKLMLQTKNMDTFYMFIYKFHISFFSPQLTINIFSLPIAPPKLSSIALVPAKCIFQSFPTTLC